MKLRPKITLIDHFSGLTDPRVERTKEHKLIDILTIAICGMISGADNWVAMEQYGNSKEEWLKQFLELPNGIPSHDTIGRVFARIDPNEFEQCFRDWVKEIAQLLPGETISIDGKTLKHSGSKGIGKKAIHLVNAWASEQRLVLGQTKVHDKSNEITAIPELIKVLELSGCLVTIDAMGTQTDIAQLIQDAGADYCLALKGNHKHLHQDVIQLFTQAQSKDWSGIEHSFYRTIEKGHGRTEIRRYWTMPTSELVVGFERWAVLQSIGLVESVRKIGQETTISKRYYLNSFAFDAQVFAHAVRSHWGIENSLHWILDVALAEDDCPIYSDYAPENLARLRKISLNLLSQEKTAKIGVANKRLKAAWDNNYLAKVLGI
ncbi:ISAs1 family transposase [Pleurocapsa sp. CCALA 161]|uniref:ISAs1 family transposase n=1 Tax=Pleurocapsa sp. CCALA 161 TaxID=2107688 RepID=UPI000D07F2DD|nr:ISAs1 family transposase [Pleurocapsa sp. CCALA 161]PSB08435.1 ISAs1 family transposase [Pleurocapsa sp. CCALA 161]